MDFNKNVTEVFDAQGTIAAAYDYSPYGPVSYTHLDVYKRQSLYCYGVDFNKNVSEVFDAQGTIAAAYDYSPYGIVGSTGNLCLLYTSRCV